MQQEQLFDDSEPVHGGEEWATPQGLYDLLDARFHFVLDAAATKENAKAPYYFTKKEDALQQSWWPYRRIWLNPPYDTNTRRGVLIQWVSKAYREGRMPCLVCCLLPAKTDTEWWHQYATKGQKMFLKGRVRFVGAPYKAKWPSVIVVFSPWRILVGYLLEALGYKASLKDLYVAARQEFQFMTNNHVEAKIRQVLQCHEEFVRVEHGVWALT